MASSLECPASVRRADIVLVLWSVRRRPMAMICSARLAARSPPTAEAMPDGLPEDAGRGRAATTTRSWPPTQSFGIVAGRKEELGGIRCGRSNCGPKVGQLVDDGGDHYIQVRDLVMQVEERRARDLSADAIGGFPGRETPSDRPPQPRADELARGKSCPAVEVAKSRPERRRRIPDHLQWTCLRLTAVFRQAIRTRRI